MTNHVSLDGVKRGRCLIPRKDNDEEENTEKKANVTLPGTVEKIIPAIGDHIPEKAEIKIEGADDLYREVRIENKVIDAEGNPVKLRRRSGRNNRSGQERYQFQRVVLRPVL